MPFIIDTTPVGALGNLASASGAAAGKADRYAQQRGIDAALIQQITAENFARTERRFEVQPPTQYVTQPGRGTRGEDLSGRIAAHREQRLAAEQNAKLNAELEDRAQREESKGKMLAALEAQYEGRSPDLAYSIARSAIETGDNIPDRVLSNLGVSTAGEDTRARAKTGQPTSDSEYQPRSQDERVSDALIRQGRFGDFAPLLNDRRKTGSVSRPDDPLSSSAQAARVMLHQWAHDPTRTTRQLMDARKQIEDVDGPDDQLEMLEQRTNEIEQERRDTEYPTVEESAKQISRDVIAQRTATAGGPLPMTQQRKIVADVLRSQLEAAEIDPRDFFEWNQDRSRRRREAQLAMTRAAEAARLEDRQAAEAESQAAAQGQASGGSGQQQSRASMTPTVYGRNQ